MRDSRVLTHGSAALQGCYASLYSPLPPSSQEQGASSQDPSGQQVSSTKLPARKSCLAEIKLLCALCMVPQTCCPGGICTTGYSVLSPPVCPIVKKADIHTLRLLNGHQIKLVYTNSMYCLRWRSSVSVQFPCLSVTHWLNVTEPLFPYLQNGKVIPKGVEWLH